MNLIMHPNFWENTGDYIVALVLASYPGFLTPALILSPAVLTRGKTVMYLDVG